MSIARKVIATISISILSGCTGFDGAQLALNYRGPTDVYPNSHFRKDRTEQAVEDENKNDTGLFVKSYFLTRQAAENSIVDPSKIPPYTKTELDNLANTESTLALQMAKLGYKVVENYCDAFFTASGDNQKWIDFTKDLTTALGTLGTGIASLSGTSASATSIIALGTATSYNGIDLYTRNFLFGAENIDSVRSLVKQALDAHATATILASSEGTSGTQEVTAKPAVPGKKGKPGKPKVDAVPATEGTKPTLWTFGAAVQQIEDHQALCQAPKIKELVKDAVKNATISAYTPAGKLFDTKPVGTSSPSGGKPASTPGKSKGTPLTTKEAATSQPTETTEKSPLETAKEKAKMDPTFPTRPVAIRAGS